MPCSDCFTTDPEPFQTNDGIAYWFLIEGNDPNYMGIKENGEIGFNFLVSLDKDPPEIEEGQEILCCRCFEKRYPIDERDDLGD